MYSIALLNAETVLHDHWGNVEYWRARRSMRFNSYLIQIATHFRATNFDSTDVKDRIQHPDDWRDETVITYTLKGFKSRIELTEKLYCWGSSCE